MFIFSLSIRKHVEIVWGNCIHATDGVDGNLITKNTKKTLEYSFNFIMDICVMKCLNNQHRPDCTLINVCLFNLKVISGF